MCVTKKEIEENEKKYEHIRFKYSMRQYDTDKQMELIGLLYDFINHLKKRIEVLEKARENE